MCNKLYLLILIVAVLFGCKKEQQKIKYYSIPDALKQVALFQKNSYWVYRNDSTGAIDCTFVKSDPELGSADYASNFQVDCVIDYIRMPLQSTLFYQFEISGKLGNASSSLGYPFMAAWIGFSRGCSPGNTAFIAHYDTLTDHDGWNSYNCSPDPKYPYFGGDKFKELGLYSSYKVNEILFDSVRKTRSIFYPSYYNPYDSIDFYFSSKRGLVKIVLRVDTSLYHTSRKQTTLSWSLLRYNVVR